MWSSSGQTKANILRHPSAIESKGFLGGNRKWNNRPASWAAPNNLDIFPLQEQQQQQHQQYRNGASNNRKDVFASVSVWKFFYVSQTFYSIVYSNIRGLIKK